MIDELLLSLAPVPAVDAFVLDRRQQLNRESPCLREFSRQVCAFDLYQLEIKVAAVRISTESPAPSNADLSEVVLKLSLTLFLQREVVIQRCRRSSLTLAVSSPASSSRCSSSSATVAGAANRVASRSSDSSAISSARQPGEGHAQGRPARLAAFEVVTVKCRFCLGDALKPAGWHGLVARCKTSELRKPCERFAAPVLYPLLPEVADHCSAVARSWSRKGTAVSVSTPAP